MKKVIVIAGLLLATSTVLPSFIAEKKEAVTDGANFMRTVKNNAFTYGEKLEYRVHYGFVNAGNIELEVKPTPVKIKDRMAFHIVGHGKSISAFDWVYKVRDKFETYIDTQGILPLQFVKNQKEGGYADTDFVIFDHKQKKYFSKKGSKATPVDIQDILSVAYYARTIDVKNAKDGTTFTLNVYLDNEIHALKFRIDGREELDTDIGKIHAVRVIPEVVNGRVFKDKDALKVWVTDDENKLPLRIQAEIMVGSIKVDITKQSGLKHAINYKK